MILGLREAVAGAILSILAWPLAVRAETPVATMITAPLVTPTDAWAYFDARAGGGSHTNGLAAFPTVPPEISAVARGLGAEQLQAGTISSTTFSQNVYDYVRNNIETEFRFGLAKGGRGALINQSGTPFDAAELMVKLLRQGGISASYQVGTINLSASEFGSWSGLVENLLVDSHGNQSFDVDAKSACQFLADGGIPSTVNGALDCNSLTGLVSSITMAHIWVQAAGNLYDPSFKRHVLKPGIDVAQAMQCGTVAASTCGSDIHGQAVIGETTGFFGPANVAYVQNANETATTTKLSAQAVNLQNYIQANMPFARLSDVVGGMEVDISWLPIAGPSLPYLSSSSFVHYTWTGDIPDLFRSSLTLQNSLFSIMLFSDEISTRRLQCRPLAFYADDISLNATHACAISPVTPLNMTVRHPYAALGGAYGAQTITPNGEFFNTYSIINSWGATGPGLQKLVAGLQAIDPYPEGPITDPSGDFPALNACSTLGSGCNPTLPTVAAMFQVQANAATAITAALTGVSITTHHVIGVVSNSSLVSPLAPLAPSFLMDARAGQSFDSKTGLGVQRAFEVSAIVNSTIEGSIGQQYLDTPEPISSISSFVFANRQNLKILEISDRIGMAATLPSLTNYSYTGSFFCFYYNPGASICDRRPDLLTASQSYKLIIPQDGTGANTWYSQPGVAGADLAIGPNQIGYLVQEHLKGGGGTNTSDPAGEVQKTVRNMDVGIRKKSYAAVSLSTGGLTFTAPADIVSGAGDFPASLPFVRTYRSDSDLVQVPAALGFSPFAPIYMYQGPDEDSVDRIGGGWTHNYQITARIGSDGARGLGRDRALDAATSITAIYDLAAILNAPTLAQRVTSFITAYWMGAQLLNNVVTINRPPTQEIFVKSAPRPDDPAMGRFLAPSGSGSQLTVTGARNGPYKFTVASGLTVSAGIRYDYSNLHFQYIQPTNGVINFDILHSTYINIGGSAGSTYILAGDRVFKANSWQFPDGNTVSFSYGISTGFWSDRTPIAQYGDFQRYYLLNVQNSFGRRLTFSTSHGGWPANVYVNGAAGGGDAENLAYQITAVSDENGRQISYARTNCPGGMFAPQGSSGVTMSNEFESCLGLTVADTSGVATIYDYTSTLASSPDPAWLSRPYFHLRRWFTPSNVSLPFEIFAYDDLFRVKTETDILGRMTKYYPGGLGDEIYKTATVLDPVGNLSTSIFDQWNSLTKATDPLGRVTTYAYDGAHRKILETRPEKDQTTTIYDVRSNVLQTVRIGKPGSGLTPTVTGASYMEGPSVTACALPPTCNAPATRFDAVAYATSGGAPSASQVTSLTYNAGGQPTRILGPADPTGLRPQIDLGYTSLAGVSLLTSKTEKISAARSTTTTYGYDASNKYVLSTAIVDGGGLALRTCFKFDTVGNLISVTDPRATMCP